MGSLIPRFLKHDSSAAAKEYGLIVAVLSVAILVGAGVAADGLIRLWGDDSSMLVQSLR